MAVITLELGWLLFVGPGHYNTDARAKHEAQQYLPRLLDFFLSCVVSASFWTAVFTAALTWSTVGLWRQTKRLASGADEQLKKMVDSTAAAQTAADAAVKSANTAERALIELERPYLVVEATVTVSEDRIFAERKSVSSIFPSLRFGTAEVIFRNLGRTPASLTFIHYVFLPSPRETIPIPIDPTAIRGRELPVGCNSDGNAPFRETENLRFRFGSDVELDFGDGTQALWLIGFARYEDIFTKCHIHGFCMAFDPVGNRFVRRGDHRYNYGNTERYEDIPQGEDL
jgi:hypothetical protein